MRMKLVFRTGKKDVTMNVADDCDPKAEVIKVMCSMGWRNDFQPYFEYEGEWLTGIDLKRKRGF